MPISAGCTAISQDSAEETRRSNETVEAKSRAPQRRRQVFFSLSKLIAIVLSSGETVGPMAATDAAGRINEDFVGHAAQTLLGLPNGLGVAARARPHVSRQH
jgi:hypothetical protein